MTQTVDDEVDSLRRANAELQQALDEALAARDEVLEQQTATAEVLGVINASPGDLASVFEALLDRALRLCSASFGVLDTYDGECFHAVTLRGVPPALADFLREPLQPVPGSVLDRMLEGEMYVHADLGALPPKPGSRRGRMVQLGGVRTSLWVPLRRDDLLLGAIGVYRQEVQPFTDKQIALLQNFAAQAVIAMENARLITETREALDQQTATAAVLGVINSSPGDLTPVFDAILEKAHSLCGAERGILFTYDGERFWPVANVGSPRFRETISGGFRPGPDNPFARVVEGEPLVHIADIAQVAAQHPDDLGLRMALQTGLRTFLILPLRKDDILVGAITANRLEVRPFTDKQIALLQNFAAQAVIAMENARLITETREALEQQTATAEVLRVINASPGNLTPVFETMLEKALSLCDVGYGCLRTYDGHLFHPVADRGNAQFSEVALGWEPFEPLPGSPPGRIVSGESVVQITDLVANAEREPGNPRALALVEIGGARTGTWVAMRNERQLLGYITAYRQEAKPLTGKQIALLQNFAAQAVIAMENARLITETREALEQQTATAEILQVINSSPGDLTPVFNAILDKAHTLCAAENGDLMMYDGEYFRGVAFRGTPEPLAELLRQPLRPTDNHQRLLRGQRLIHNPDVSAGEPTSPLHRAAVDAGVRTLLMIPLRRDDTLLGYITARRLEVQPFTDKQIALLENFAAQAVIAMENARLLGELRERNDEIAGWNQELEERVAAQLAEIERAGKLRRFLAPQLADLIVAQGDESILESHRREIVVVFCDLRGFTAFAERAEAEEVMELLRDYHAAMGPIVAQYEGTVDHYSGDGIMVFFNDPVPTPEPAKRAIDMAVAMREAVQPLLRLWRRQGHDLGFGVGIAQGYATLGQIGFAERMDYTAIGTVTNLAARLCAEAQDGQILVARRAAIAVEDTVKLEEIGDLALKGLSQAVAVYNVVAVGAKTSAS